MTDTQPNTLKGRSYQELFDEMLDHLRKQGEPAASAETNMCHYRFGSGLKCAVGALIPDEVYDLAMERMSLTEIIQILRGEELDDNAVPEEYAFLADARSYLHDRAARAVFRHCVSFRPQVEEGAKILAERYNLIYTPPKN